MRAIVFPSKENGTYNNSRNSYVISIIGPFNKMESIERRAREWATIRGYNYWSIELYKNNTIREEPDEVLFRTKESDKHDQGEQK